MVVTYINFHDGKLKFRKNRINITVSVEGTVLCNIEAEIFMFAKRN